MFEASTPVTVSHDIDPNRVPRVISHAAMRQYEENQAAMVLSQRERHRMFLRYDNTWWIGDPSGFTELTSQTQAIWLDRWQARHTYSIHRD